MVDRNIDERREALGPAERVIKALTSGHDHMVHNRPGLVVPDATSTVGLKWSPVTHKEEDGKKIVYRLDKRPGKKRDKKGKIKMVEVRVKIGALWADGTIRDENRRKLAEYRSAGIFPEVAIWMYRQVADIWAMDNEFAARWASHAFPEEHKDLKVVLAAFMLVQSRKGDPVKEGGEVLFFDEDYRDVGEAMCLLRRKDKRGLDAKLLLRVYKVLSVDGVAAINRELGFGRSARRPALGRWPKVVTRWLRHREDNPRALEGLVKHGSKETVKELCRRVGYKPQSPKFFETLGWSQHQAEDGRRGVAIGQDLNNAETWDGMTEQAICELIMREKPGYKRIIGLVPKDPGLTRAIVAAAVEAGSLSNKDLVIATPTLEELGLLQVQEVKHRWDAAMKAAEDMRAMNIAKRVKSKEIREQLEAAADTAVQKAVEEEMKDLWVYIMVDVSASMGVAIEAAKSHVSKILPGFPEGQVFVCVFTTSGREIAIKHRSAAGVRNAFKGIMPGGGTDYGAGIRALQHHKPPPGTDALFLFVGDGLHCNDRNRSFTVAVQQSGLNPLAFGYVHVGHQSQGVQTTAAQLGVPCFMVSEETFEDVYAIPRTMRNLIAATPVGAQAVGAPAPARVTLVERILKTELLVKPPWALPEVNVTAEAQAQA